MKIINFEQLWLHACGWQAIKVCLMGKAPPYEGRQCMKNSDSLGQTPFYIFLCGHVQNTFYSPANYIFECKFNSELALLSPKGTILSAKKHKKTFIEEFQPGGENQTSLLLDSFFRKSMESPCFIESIGLPIWPNPLMVVFRVTLWLLLLLTCYFRQPRLLSIRVKLTLSYPSICKRSLPDWFSFKLWIFSALWFGLICSVTCVQGMYFLVGNELSFGDHLHSYHFPFVTLPTLIWNPTHYMVDSILLSQVRIELWANFLEHVGFWCCLLLNFLL